MKNGVLSNFTRSHISSDRVRSGYEIRRNPALFNGIFNWTFTYGMEWDFFVPYGHYGPLNPDEIDRKLACWQKESFGLCLAGYEERLFFSQES